MPHNKDLFYEDDISTVEVIKRKFYW